MAGVFDRLKVTPLSRATSVWANEVIDALNLLYGMAEERVTYEDLKNLKQDIKPAEAGKYLVGDEGREWLAIYGYYGFFDNNVFVQGRRVLKDGDPITLYDISDLAKSKISQAIDQTKTKEFIGEIRDKMVKLRMDEYGNVGVIIAEPIDEYGRVKVSAEVTTKVDLDPYYKPVYARDSISAGENAYGFEVSLKKDGRPNVTIYYKLGGAGDIYVEISLDGSTWRVLDKISLTSADEGTRVYQAVTYPYIRLRTPTTGIDVEFEICASR